MTTVWILTMGLGFAVLWMAVVSMYAEKLIKWAVCAGLCNMAVMAALNLALGNIPGAIILLLYLLLKVAWYYWMRNSFAFAAQTMKTALHALKNNPGPFVVAVFMFASMAVWCVVFGGAVFRFYSQVKA